jgi:hypothetical protein
MSYTGLNYTWEQAVKDGNLIDVTGLAQELGSEHEVAISRAIWVGPSVNRCVSKLRPILESLLLWEREYRERGWKTREMWQLVRNPVTGVRQVKSKIGERVVREERGGYLRLTFLKLDESFDLRCPRPNGGSFYTM